MFILQAAKKYTQIGAIAPFSETTIGKCIGLIKIKHQIDESLVILELGSGEGWFTNKLCKTFTNSIIHWYEINEDFLQSLSKLNYENLVIHWESAENIAIRNNYADIIISTLPFTIFDDELTTLILESSKKALKKNWLCFIIQYSDYSSDLINKVLWKPPIYTDRVVKNMPPAKIFVYH